MNQRGENSQIHSPQHDNLYHEYSSQYDNLSYHQSNYGYEFSQYQENSYPTMRFMVMMKIVNTKKMIITDEEFVRPTQSFS